MPAMRGPEKSVSSALEVVWLVSSVEAVRDRCDVWWPWDQIFRYLHIMIALEFPSSDTSSTIPAGGLTLVKN